MHLLLVRADSETDATDSSDWESLDKAVASCLSDLPCSCPGSVGALFGVVHLKPHSLPLVTQHMTGRHALQFDLNSSGPEQYTVFSQIKGTLVMAVE